MYNPQGWWPLVSYNGNKPTKTGAIKGYHPLDYSFPQNEAEKFEICLGCFLTQNTNWQSVEKALLNLKKVNALTAKGILKLSDGKFREMIKPSGYFNQKAKYIKEFIPFFELLKGSIPNRDELLALKGIGAETADSMLLYAFKQPEFIVDSYTKRIFTTLKIINWKDSYDQIKEVFESSIKSEIKDKLELVKIYQEYHALIVEHAKRYYSKKPYGKDCPFLKIKI